ncbi:MAG: carboxypeptidase-like regulatory domain-containing protein [Pyrinomonadaceae bacterium]
MRFNYPLLLVTLGALLLNAEAASSCSCVRAITNFVVPYKRLTQSNKDSAVFVGKALSYERIYIRLDEGGETPRRIYRFAVEETFGNLKTKQVEIETGDGCCDCGYLFDVGERYFVFAHRSETTNRLTSSVCDGTVPITHAIDYVEIFRAASRRKPESRIFGRVIDFNDPNVNGARGITVVAEGEEERLKTVTDRLGQYRFVGIRPSKYKVRVIPPTGRRSSPVDLDKVSDHVEIVIEPQSYSELDFWLETVKP